MKLAITLNAHNNTDLVMDTLDAVFTYATKDVLLIYDEAAKQWGTSTKFPVPKIEGLYHNYFKAPYRNMTLGLWHTYKTYPEADWYCYMEPDVLFCSSEFKEDLANFEKDVWVAGNEKQQGNQVYSLLELISGIELERQVSILGCCVFLRGCFIEQLANMNFFDKFLHFTNDFQNGFFPGFDDYDFGEHLFPTLAVHMGGTVSCFATWVKKFRLWRGSFRKYPMRFTPELDPILEDYPEACICHPLKAVNHPIRETRRVLRHATKKRI